MVLIGSSDPDAVRRDQLRWHFEQRVVLTSSVCRELVRADDTSRRPRAALHLLAQWMRDHYADLPNGDVKFTHGLNDAQLIEVAGDLRLELELGSVVCESLMMLFTADTPTQADGDRQRLRTSLHSYMSQVEK